MRTIALSLALLMLPTVAGAQSVYKWTDKQGVTHYSQLPPEDRKSEEHRVKSGVPKEPQPPVAAAKQPAGSEMRKQACDIAKKNLETLKSAKRVWIPAPKAAAAPATATATADPAAAKPVERTLLNDDQRAEEVKRAESQIHFLCDA